MRILFITHFFPPNHTEGTENYTLGLAQTFLARGHEVQVVCAESWQTGEAYWNGVTEDIHERVTVHRLRLNWTKANNPNQILYDSLRVEEWIGQFLSLMKPDIVHVTSTYTLGVGVLRSVRRAGIPLVLTLMDFWFLCARNVLVRGDGKLCSGLTTPQDCQQCLLTSSGLYHRTQSVLPSRIQFALWNVIIKTPVLARLRGARGMALDMADRKAKMKQVLELPNRILAHSRFVQNMFAQTGVSQRVEYLPNGHELSWASDYQGKSKSSMLRFGFMGQVGPTKGVELLIEAFQIAHLRNAAHLDIWGDLNKHKDYTNTLKALIGNSDSISLRGRFARDQLADVLAEIDVLVVPSIWYENAPLVIYEAFATKTPVIATNLGGMAEAITHDVNGLLFERGNVADLARQLRRLVKEPGLLQRLQAGVPQVKTIGEEVTELEAVYRQATIRRKQPILTFF